MTPPVNDKSRRLLRAYLLSTCSDKERRQIERHLSESETWREALEQEQQALALLDVSPDVVPEKNLTAFVMHRVEQIKEKPKPRFSVLRVAVATAAGLVLVMAVLIPSLARTREAARRASSQNNLKQLGTIFKMYSNENNEQYPPVSRYGYWTPDLESLYPGYMQDPYVLINPRASTVEEDSEAFQKAFQSDPIDWKTMSRIAAENYTYTGWLMKDEADAQLINEVRRRTRVSPDKPIQIAQATIPRLSEGIERFLITDVNNPGQQERTAQVPVAFENLAAARDFTPPGCNVVFMDGHVEWIRYGTKFPVTKAVADAFASE